MEVLGTSGYEFYHADDLESIIECHKICKFKKYLIKKNLNFSFTLSSDTERNEYIGCL